MDNEMIERFFLNQNTAEETEQIGKWLQESPEHEKEFQNAYKLFVASQMVLSEKMKAKPAARRTGFRKILWYAAGLAAAAVVGVFATYDLAVKPMQKEADKTCVLAVAPGQRSTITLSDGTVIDLNSGSHIEYPAVFRKDERRVRLTGEAMFNVAHDPDHPFIVEAGNYNVKVLGTRFDVIADNHEFSTALLEGSICITDVSGKELLRLRPSQKASLSNDGLIVEAMEDGESLWTDGVISVTDMPFDRLMARFRRCFGVKIEVDGETMPQIHYAYMKIRISDGIAHALDMLQRRTDFTWAYDETTGIYHIKTDNQ